MSKYIKLSDLSESELLELRQIAREKFMRRVMASIKSGKSKHPFCVRYRRAMDAVQVGIEKGMQPWQCVSVAWLMRSHPQTALAIERMNKLAVEMCGGGNADGPRHLTFDEICGCQRERRTQYVHHRAFSNDWYLYRDDSNANDDAVKCFEEAAR